MTRGRKAGVTDESRFGEKVMPEPMSGCWLWIANTYGNGYGQFWLHGRKYLAHRASYEMHVGAIPEGLDLDHLCSTRICVNPAHLEPVTRRVNLLRSATTLPAIALAKTHCPQGHPLTEANVYRAEGHRRCRCCKITRERDRRARLRTAA